MHNVYSYNHPKEFAEYWSTNAFLHEYSLRYLIRFDLPLVKSIRLSQLPLFKFAQIYNNFPEDFKTIMERKEFVSKLEDFYGKQFKNESCNNLFCRMCSYESWLNHRNNYIVFPKTLNYIKYQITVFKSKFSTMSAPLYLNQLNLIYNISVSPSRSPSPSSALYRYISPSPASICQI